MYPLNSPCVICRKKNTLNNDVYMARRIKCELERVVENASEDEVEAKNKALRQNPYLRDMTETHFRCDYGIHCTQLNTNELKQLEREISELLVLAKICDKQKTLSLQNYFRGKYPKAARYIFE